MKDVRDDFALSPLPVLSEAREMSVSAGDVCVYLPGRVSRFRAFMAGKLSAEDYQACMDAGFRRSGLVVYQPVCEGCRKCVPLRVEVAKLALSKSQRRALRKNADVVVRAGVPEVTAEKWEAYDRYQREWHGGGNGEQAGDPAGFVRFLYQSPVETLEFVYRDAAGKLLGVGICDVLKKCVSSVYFYFDPDERRRSLGTFSALYEMMWAKEMGIPYWYGGYWVEGCGAMDYKTRFQPCELLGVDGQWREMK